MLERLGRASARRHRRVLIGWAIAAMVIVALSESFGGTTNESFTIPGAQSFQAQSLLEANAPSLLSAGMSVVFEAPPGAKITDEQYKNAVEATLTKLKALPHVNGNVSDPFTPTLPPTASPTATIPNTDITWNRILPQPISTDGTVALASVTYDADIAQLPADTFAAAQTATAAATQAGVQVSFGGGVADALDPPPAGLSQYAELIGLLCAALILLVALGSVTAMVVPIGVAVFGIIISTSLLSLCERWISIGSAAPEVGTMIGLGVGIDYSLFILNRYRQNLGEQMDRETAVARAVSTSGSSVLFAGVTVCLALCGLTMIGIPYVATLGIGAAIFVIVSVIAALTVVPALLGLLGRHIESLRLPWHKPAAEETPDALAKTFSSRWAHEVARRPVLFAVLSLGVLVVLILPVRSMQLGINDDGSSPAGTTQRTAYDVISSAPGFGPGRNGPLLVVADLGPTWAAPSAAYCSIASGKTPATTTLTADQQADLTAMGQLGAAMLGTPGVQSVSPVPCTGSIAVLAVTPTTGPSDAATSDLVGTLRTTTIPNALNGTSIAPSAVTIGGTTAVVIDLADTMGAKMPLFLGAVLLISFVLLMIVFRSLAVPLNAVIMNLLSIGATLGFLVAVFQWGWGQSLLGLSGTVPIVAYVPVMMFAILFGLSMDYEVFLLSRIREAYLESGDSRSSVVVGLGSTARVITAAALIMMSVFVTYALNPNVVIKMLALGMAVAVFIDATVVRMIAVPATMELTAKANWWLPGWLDRILPHLNVDAPNPAPSTDDGPGSGGGGSTEPEPTRPTDDSDAPRADDAEPVVAD
jgi:RND superfamily putative drug exporter